MYTLGKRSLNNISGCHSYIQMIVKRAITLSIFDFGIIKNGGLRTIEMQSDIFKNGYSKCDGIIKKSYHQSGKAVDLVPYVDGNYTWKNKAAFIGVLQAWNEAEIQLKKELLIPETIYFHHGIFWNWEDLDKDGVIEITDRLGWDAAHHEIRTKKQLI